MKINKVMNIKFRIIGGLGEYLKRYMMMIYGQKNVIRNALSLGLPKSSLQCPLEEMGATSQKGRPSLNAIYNIPSM